MEVTLQWLLAAFQCSAKLWFYWSTVIVSAAAIIALADNDHDDDNDENRRQRLRLRVALTGSTTVRAIPAIPYLRRGEPSS